MLALLLFAAALPRGEIVERVEAQANPQQSYALYLPSGYSTDRAWPILFCFDPGARGRVPVERFKDAAERFGWIVVGSNNSRNGPYEIATTAAEAIWNDVHSRFRIDPARVYAAGFSGGAKVATGIAISTGSIAGVIISGGTFPGGKPPRDVKFGVYAAAGTEDFNLTEVRTLYRLLAAQPQTAARFAIFEGTHEWLPPGKAVEAVEWMQFRAGLDDAWPELRTNVAVALEQQGRAAEACNERMMLAHDLETPAPGCLGSKEVREYERRISEEERRESDLIARLGARDTGDVKRLASRADDSEQRRTARRVLNGVFVGHVEAASAAERAGDLAQALVHYHFCAELKPDNARVWEQIARLAQQNGARKRADKAAAKAAALRER